MSVALNLRRGASQDSAHSSSALYAMYDAMAPQTKKGALPIPTSPALMSPAFNDSMDVVVFLLSSEGHSNFLSTICDSFESFRGGVRLWVDAFLCSQTDVFSYCT